MTMWRNVLSIAILSGLMCLSVSGAPSKRGVKKNMAKQKAVNMRMRVDSVDWLRERYCDMLEYDRSRTGQAIKDLQRNFRQLPAATRDSLLAAHYSAIVRLFEEERNGRAYAFADCYYALAEEDDANLGTLYLNDIVLAIEQDDTVKLRKRMTQLEDYALRNNLDYDADLADAEVNMDLCRHRIKFKETPLGDFAGEALWTLDPEIIEKENVMWIGYVPILVSLYKPSGWNEQVNIRRYSPYGKFNKTPDSLQLEEEMPKAYGMDMDQESKTLYCVWGKEKTQSANPRLLGAGRQFVQHAHASVTGELARKKYSYKQRLLGNATATLVDAGLNALFNWLSVTTEHYYRCELSLTLTAPDMLEGVLSIETTTVKSNDLDHPDTKRATLPLKYYRMSPEYGSCIIHKGKPVATTCTSRMKHNELTALFKSEIKKREKPWKEAQKQWKKEHPGWELTFDKFEDQYNYEVIEQLREKSQNSLMTHPLTQP